MRALLGIDIGGSASRWVALSADGTVLARGSAPGATGLIFTEADRRRFATMVAEIAVAAPPVEALHAGITGLGPAAHDATIEIFASALAIRPERITLTDDMTLAFEACFRPGQGHLVSAGTGSIGVHLTSKGELVRVGGRGILIDDGGSGAWIALRAIDRLCRLLDETGSTDGASRLASGLFSAVGGDGWDAVRSFVYGGDRGNVGSLARVVAGAALAGDEMAAAVLRDAVGELARLARALVRRAGQLPVAFIGGVLDLTPTMRSELAAALPGLDVAFPRPDAALRAAELALEAVRERP